MRRAPPAARAAALTAIVAIALAGPLGAAPIELATDAPQPLSPAESAKRFRLPPGFRIELVAGEPLVADPVAMDFDAKGRIFVCEIHGYNLEGYLDVLELNKTGTLDTAVRRVPANENAVKKAALDQYGTVKLLEDTDGDGRMDRATVWADRLPPCYGVVAARDGVVVLCAPDVLYLADRDGDGKPEIQEKLFTGFGLYDLWSRINNPRWGLDNWIHAANGISSGGTIRGRPFPDGLKLDSTCFRFKPDGSALEPDSGSASGYGLTMNDWGDRFLVQNQQHVLMVAPLEHRYLARNPYYAAPNPVVNASTYGTPAVLYPTSQPDPWRLARSKDPAWVRFYGAAETTANGFFTAASGQAIYLGDQFPAEYYGNHFSVDNAQNLIHRCLLTPQGALYSAQRPREDERTEFLTSTEEWFRPVNLLTGPDGALYVVDMYRAIIEDYSAIPRHLQQRYIESLIAGSDKGRIWRIVAGGAARPERFDLTRASGEELVRRLASVNAWWRTTAQRLLVERQDKRAVPLLAALVREGKTPQARLHALGTLDGLDALAPEVAEAALGDPHFAVRAHALALAERWLDRRPSLAARLEAMVDDLEPRVRLQLALSLGESKSPEAVRALQTLAARHAGDRWMQAAILSSSASTAHELLAAIVRRPDEPGQARALVHPLASTVGARHRDEDLGLVLASLADAHADKAPLLQIDCLKGLLEGLQRGRTAGLDCVPGQIGLRRLLGSTSPQVAELALKVAGLVKLRESAEMKTAFDAAARTAADAKGSLEDRLAAITLLASAPFEQLAGTVPSLLDPRQPLDVQLAAIRAIVPSEDPQVGKILLANWQTNTPKTQQAAMDALFARQNRLPGLLDALAAGTVPLSSLDAFRRVQLLENPDAAIRERARAVLGAQLVRKDRQEVIARYTAALARARDPARGKLVHEKQCSKCHQVQGQGYVVGPDMSSITRRSDEMLVSDVLDPSNQITAGYNQYTIVTDDGRIFTGVLAAETATSVTLRREQAADDVILRRSIDVMAASTNSMMPENLEKEVTPEEVADLIAYLRTAYGPVAPPLVTLFDDDRSFPSLLTGGDGRAFIEPADHYSGAVSLGITPPQRWSLKIPGWEYHIAENPGPGEFRYLRFAWKSRGGQGIMLELAADGQWPPAETPLRRYYAGKNTTGWAAVQVAPQVPAEWTVVTCDLWKDSGFFTLTGLAPTTMGGEALFDRIELVRSLDALPVGKP